MPLRGLLHILSIYVLYLCCCPCADVNCIDTDADIVVVNTDKSGDRDNAAEGCSSFCFDGCCATHILSEIVFTPINFVDFNNEEVTFHFFETFPQQLISSIWQPPKI